MELNKVQAIKKFFEADGGRPVTLAEMKQLSAEEKLELATLAAQATGDTLTKTPEKA